MAASGKPRIAVFLREFSRHFLPPRLVRFVKQLFWRLRKSPESIEKEKPRIRTDEELALQAQGLREVTDIFNFLKIPYYVGGGALLGSLRSGDFVPWDCDVDIETKTECILPKQEVLLSALLKAGFEIQIHDPSPTDFKIIAMKRGSKFEILGYFKLGAHRYRRRCYYPDAFGQEGSEILLRGETFKTYRFPEKYLEWFYGDWRTPVRKKNYYYTASSRTGPFALTLMEIVCLYRRLLGRLRISHE